MDLNQIEAAIEAILFASGAPVEISRIEKAIEIDEKTLVSIMSRLNDKYSEPRSGLKLLKLDDKYQLCTKSEQASYVKVALDTRRDMTLSSAALEVLAIIAYNQPVTRPFIEQIRGVDCSSIINNLLEKNLIEEKGKLDVPGRPRLFATTSEFLRCFGISSVMDLPEITNSDENQGEPIHVTELI